MSSRNTRRFLASTLQELADASISAWIFGGWAEELHGIRAPGPHRDIDLLYPAADFSRINQLLLSRTDLEEVPGKRFVHKRAFQWQSVLIELFLLRPAPTGLVSDFFGLHLFQWPEDTLSQTVLLLGAPVPAASTTALCLYRQQHEAVATAYQQHLTASRIVEEK